MMMIVLIPMISNSPRCATIWATPVRKPKEVSAKITNDLARVRTGEHLQFFKNIKDPKLD